MLLAVGACFLIMRLFFPLLAIASFLLFLPATALGNPLKDSAQQVISRIDQGYKEGQLTRKRYLDSVYTTMRSFLSANIFFTNRECIALLGLYRKTIWEEEKGYEHKRKYYGILANQSQMSGRMGETLYYAEKIEKLEQSAYNRPSLTALSIIGGYYEVHRAPGKVLAIYENVKDYFVRVPLLAEKDSLNENDLVQSVIVLEKVANAYYELGKIAGGQAAEALMQEIASVTRKKYGTDNNVMSNVAYLQYMTSYAGASTRKDIPAQRQVFQQLESLLNSNETPGYLKYYIHRDIIDRKIDFFLSVNNQDSASYYLKLYKGYIEEEGQPYNLHLFHKSRAKNLYNEGRMKESADALMESLAVLDSSRSIAIKDVDDILYAQAEAEEKQLLLEEAGIKQRKTERILLLAAVALGVLLLGGIFVIRFIRHRQQERFLNFKLNLARNIHDEANPALLYARALARSQSGSVEKTELEKHIEHTMALIRSLSHDLRSNQQYTVSSLIESVEQLLSKLNADNSFQIRIYRPADGKRFISHYQYSELKAILNECITNTIKHARFSKVEVDFKQQQNRLIIVYRDDGEGWSAEDEELGMGLQNIRERAGALNGECTIVNQYPEGYSITVSVLLR